MRDYYRAHSTWEMLEKIATAYLEDTNIHDKKKQWIAEYMQSDTYSNAGKG